MSRNHVSVSGPKTLPSPAVPRLCTANSPIRMTTVMSGMRNCRSPAKKSVATSRPSMAESTEMAGVIMPSP